MFALHSIFSLRAVSLALLMVVPVIIVYVAGFNITYSRFLGDPPSQIPTPVALALVIFVAASVSSTVGFAFSAIAAAMIFHFVPDHVEAVQIMMIASIAIQAYCVAGLYRTISWRACAPFLLGGIAVMPVGIYLFLAIRPNAYLITIGVGVAAYGMYMLFKPTPPVASGGTLADIAVGALGGITGPLVAFPGAFLTIWCGMRGWDKLRQRSIYQPYILVLQVLALGAMSVIGERGIVNPHSLVYALPGIAGAWLGLHVFQRLTDAQFQKFVNVALVISGVALVLR